MSDTHIQELMTSYREQLGDAVDRNFKVWGYSFQEDLLVEDGSGTSRNIRSYEQALTQLETTIHKRLAYLDQNIEALYNYCI